MSSTLLPGTIHDLPADMQDALIGSAELVQLRNALTPLARNEWICRVTIVKKAETREKHIHRLCQDLTQGKHRPCCRPGCPHHRPQTKVYFPGME